MADYRGFFPGVFTMGNVICGFLSILSAFEGNVTTACWFIVLAGFLDALDGRVARMSGTTSQFGVELDDVVWRVVAHSVPPSVSVLSWALHTEQSHWSRSSIPCSLARSHP